MEEELDRAESFKILQHAADDLRGVADIENKKDPAVKKWEEAKAIVPKKHKKDFYQKAYEESKKDKEWQRKQEKIIPPNTERISFLLDDKFFEKPKNQNAREHARSCHREEMKDHEKEKFDKWLDHVEMVDIDFTSVNDLSYAPKHYLTSSYGIGSFYKDGVLLRFNNKKNNSNFHLILNVLSTRIDKEKGETDLKLEEDSNFNMIDMGCFMIQEHGVLNQNFQQDTVYMFSDWKDWKKECFNNFNFPIYIIFENFSKTRAVKINLKDNIHINYVKNAFLKENKCTEKNIFEYEFPKGMPYDNYKKILDAKAACMSAIYLKKIHADDISAYNTKLAGCKKGILMGGWATSLEFNTVRAVTLLRDHNELSEEELIHVKKIVTSTKGETKDGKTYVRSSLIRNKELQNFLVDLYDLVGNCKKNNSVYFILKKVREFIEKHKRIDVTNKEIIKQFVEMKDVQVITSYYMRKNANLDTPASKALSVDEKVLKKFMTKTLPVCEMANYLFLYITLFYNTGGGLRLPKGQNINFENFTESDCAVYWTHTPQILLSEYFTGISVANKAPLLIKGGKVINDISLNERNINDIHIMDECLPPYPNREMIYKGEELQPILNEAFDNEIYNFVWGSGAELNDDIFRYLRFFELDKEIIIFACDKRNRYLFEILDKGNRSFVGLFFNKTNHPDTVEEASKSIYMKFATLTRDVKVIIDRVANLSYQGRRQPRDLEIPLDEPMEIMTPRTRYPRRRSIGSRNGLGGDKQLNRTNVYRTAGFRIAHLRRLVGDAKASKEAKEKAGRDERIKTIPEGYTYVSGANWDKRTMSKREVIYRNKTLTSIFYATDEECKKVQSIDEMSGLAFEEFSKTYLQRRKLRVDYSRNVDHGIDIVAFEKDGTKVVVQCKNNRKKPIGPDIVRALCGSPDYKDSKEKVRGMIIASGGFTRGAKDYAEQNNIELVSDELLE